MNYATNFQAMSMPMVNMNETVEIEPEDKTGIMG